MAKLTRQAQKIFAGQAPSDMIAAFGSTQTGTPVYSTDLSTLQTTNYEEGWQEAIIADKAPFLEEMNGVMYGTTYQLAYLMQQGIPEWDAGTTYYTNSRAMGSDGNIYKSLTDDNTGNNPTTDSGTNWVNDSGGAGMPVGTIFAHTCAADFVPENSLPCDGTEYAQVQFPALYNNWLASGNLETCTYEEYQEEVTSTGECLKWALDTTNQKFKVPTKINKILAINKNIPVKGNGMTLGWTDGTNFAGTGTEIPSGGSPTGVPFVNDYGKNVGVASNRTEDLINSVTIGITPDSSKSGIETDITNTTFKSIRFFVVVATGAINQSEMDWSEWASSLTGKLNISLDNATQATINALADKLIPKYSEAIQLDNAYGVEKTYEVVAYGRVNIRCVSISNIPAYINLNGQKIASSNATTGLYTQPCTVDIIVRPGDVVTYISTSVSAHANNTEHYAYFYPY